MAHRFYSSASLLPLALVVMTLSSCQTAPPVKDVAPSINAIPPIVDDAQYRGLEERVQNLEGQMRAAQPTLKKVDAIESHFKALSFELDKISEHYKAGDVPVAVVAEPVPVTVRKELIAAPIVGPRKADVKKPEAKKEIAKAPIIAPQAFAVTSVRIGEQDKDITRIVLDTTNVAEIHYDLDNTEGLLVIDIPKAKWATTQSQLFTKSPMVKSFKAVSDESGAHFVTDLKQKAKVVATARLAPSGASGHRVYIDIAPAK